MLKWPRGEDARERWPRRVAVIDAAAVDRRRSVVLIRRDNIEHLLMIGGPTDVVIEPTSCALVRASRRGALRPDRIGLPLNCPTGPRRPTSLRHPRAARHPASMRRRWHQWSRPRRGRP
ncbi:MAG: flagellar biosynthesis protein FliO, partial [Pseudolabrys sp.]